MNADIGTVTSSSAVCASTDLSAIRQQAFDIDRQAGDIEIPIAAVFDKIDDMLDQTPAGIEALNAINCFAT